MPPVIVRPKPGLAQAPTGGAWRATVGIRNASTVSKAPAMRAFQTSTGCGVTGRTERRRRPMAAIDLVRRSNLAGSATSSSTSWATPANQRWNTAPASFCW